MTLGSGGTRGALGRLLALVLVTGTAACSSGDGEESEAALRRPPTEATHVHAFASGETRDVTLTEEATGELVDLLCRAVERTDMVLRVPMNVDVGTIMSEERGIEVVLAEPRELHAGSTGITVAPTRLLVPLSGRFGGEESGRLTIFYGAPEYAPGPLAVSSGRDSLLQLLASIGVE